ncbi:protein TIC 20-II, chloroplastic [Alnus glutinosa]|uniref:protein TIC 20-II, chloroplastic n=1 Tax=Alnus glutinosa TaxID=3517 RepID=UPI002D78B43A|nr:protein TIC 20-II, chloroplastic [Alnus glutinosa]
MACIPLLRLSATGNLSSRSGLFLEPHVVQPKLIRAAPAKRSRSGSSTITRMSYNPTPATDRLISAVSYTLPFFNSLQYGRFLFLQYPPLGSLFDPLLPLLSLYRSIPYSSFVAFFALYLGVVRNPSFSRYVRFNSMQAVTLDVLLVLPLLLQRVLSPGRSGVGFRVMVWGHNVLFVFSVLCFVYSFVSCVLGRTPYLPFVADAAGRQI